MRWLLVLAGLMTPFTAMADAVKDLLDKPVATLPASPRPRKITPSQWVQLASTGSLVSRVNPDFSESTPLRNIMTDSFYRQLRQSKIPSKFVLDMSYSKLPFNLTPAEFALFEADPGHPLFTHVNDLPFAGPRPHYVKSRLVNKNMCFVIHVVKALQHPISDKRSLFYKIGDTGMHTIVQTIATHLAGAAEHPLCKTFFSRDLESLEDK